MEVTLNVDVQGVVHRILGPKGDSLMGLIDVTFDA